MIERGQVNWDAIPTKTITQPAAGANFSYTIPAGKRGRVEWLGVKLVNDANAANRAVLIECRAVGAALSPPLYVGPCATQTLGVTSMYFLGLYITESDVADAAIRKKIASFPFELEAAGAILVTVSNKQVGDQLTIYWGYKEAMA